jgi:hypothetical protein
MGSLPEPWEKYRSLTLLAIAPRLKSGDPESE